MPTRPIIGSRFTGKPRIVQDRATGHYSHCLPEPSADDERLQLALLARPQKKGKRK